MDTLISVIIPCYNVEKWVDRCVQSVVEQTIDRDMYEIILVNDCSTDRTEEHLLRWEKEYPENILVVSLDKNGRLGKARNIGLEYANGEWVTFLDSDDWIEKDYLEKLFSVARESSYDFVACRYMRDPFEEKVPYYLSEEEKKTGSVSRAMLIDSDEKRDLLLFLQPVPYSGCYRLIRKQFIIENELFFPEGVAYEDTAWGCLVNCCVRSFYILEEKLYHYYINYNATVLKRNASYQKDLLIVQEYKWRELERRNALEKHREVLEYDYLVGCYLSFIKILALRMDNPSFEDFMEVWNLTRQRVADLNSNRYVKEGLSEFHQAILNTLNVSMDKNAFDAILEAVRKHGGM